MTLANIVEEYGRARAAFAEEGVDTEAALEALAGLRISLPCWQGDDVRGFEVAGEDLADGGIRATGGRPGAARTVDELRDDLDVALGLIPGRHRVNLHAIYGEFDVPARRDAIGPESFAGWLAWASERGLGLDFNATLFAHPMAASGFTLASKDAAVRAYWLEHVRRCRRIAAWLGERQGNPCVHNLWLPDGMKDACVDAIGYRRILQDSLDRIYEVPYAAEWLKDSVESKLFGIGSEALVVGSYEFYLAYALRRGIMPCLDLGHFHPTESVAEKLSALLLFFEELLLHVSRGVRWDSDHVPILDETLRSVALEIVRCDGLRRVRLAVDSFDASISRVGAWVTGARAVLSALLLALLEPRDRLVALESEGDYFGRLALLERLKLLPSGAVWDMHCVKSGVPAAGRWEDAVRRHDRMVASQRA